ncbi:restriction endonuclease subunit S [Vibrio splendidus]|uniref:restriction endonuclease subunit S n=1 Tax=Vibrio splendidus TaxID=29497 RepID=UPI0024686596|nr:restriction endonuclease subunit S [Vibrio splendidus]MDH5934056.1 restriction endonuclease subunit S [Vibrio splendidus]
MSFDNLPRGWQLIPLEDAMDAIIDYRGKTPKKTESGIPLITAKIVKGGYVLEPFEFIAEDNYDSWMVRGLPQVGDVVLTTEAPLGEIAQLTSANVALAQRIVTLRGKKGLLDSDFLLCALQSDFVQHQLESRASGSTVKGIKQSELRKVSLPIPPLLEQHKISQVLKSLSNKLVCNTKTNQILEEMAQAIFKSWFVDFDPVKAKMSGEQPEGMDAATASLFPEKLVESELGFIPEGWEVDSLSSVVDVIMGQSPKGTTYNDQNVGTPLVNGPVEFGVYHPVAQKWTTAPTKLSKDKDLIVCVRGSTTGRYVVSDGEYCLGRGVCSVRSDDYPAFANYLFKSQLNNLLILTTGSTFPSWSGPTLKHFKVVVPPKSIIEKYEAIVGNLCSMMAQNTGENESLASLRDMLLPKLFSGEIELDKVLDV